MHRRQSMAVMGCSFAASLALGSSVASAQNRLIAITGNQGGQVTNDETLYEVSTTDASMTPLIQLPFIPDTDAIGFNPSDGLLYRTSGANAYSNSPSNNGFRDNQFLQTVDVLGGTLAQNAIFNANSEQFGPTAPRPDWVRPVERRTDDQTDQSFRVRGPDEYHSLRDFVWSNTESLFYGADEEGVFTLTPGGDSTFVGRPVNESTGAPEARLKGISFFTINGDRRLLASNRDGAELWTIDPATGQKVGSPVLVFDPLSGAPVSGILSLEESPDGQTLYGVNKGSGAFNRSLISIDPATGASTFIGNLEHHVADLAFVVPEPSSLALFSLAALSLLRPRR